MEFGWINAIFILDTWHCLTIFQTTGCWGYFCILLRWFSFAKLLTWFYYCSSRTEAICHAETNHWCVKSDLLHPLQGDPVLSPVNPPSSLPAMLFPKPWRRNCLNPKHNFTYCTTKFMFPSLQCDKFVRERRRKIRTKWGLEKVVLPSVPRATAKTCCWLGARWCPWPLSYCLC